MPASRSGSRTRQRSSVQGFRLNASWPRVATITCAGVLASLLLWGWVNLLPLLLVPALVGLAMGCCLRTRAEALIAGLIAGVLGSALAVWIYEPNRIASAIQAMPSWMRGDVTTAQYTVGAQSISAGAMGYAGPQGMHFPMIAAGSLLVPAFSVAVTVLRERQSTRRASALIPWFVSLLATLCLLSAVLNVGLGIGWFNLLDSPLGPGMYQTDMIDNLRTLEIMKIEGKGYYDASLESAAGDVRTREAVNAAGGKFVGISSAQIRQPAMFYVWRLATLLGPFSAIGWLSIALASAILPLSFWGLKSALGDRALFVGFALFPGLVFWSTGYASLEPEWWAVLLLTAAFLCLARRRVALSLALAFAAVLIRETAGWWLLSVSLTTLLFGLYDRRWLRIAAVAAALLAAAIVAFAVHVKLGSAYVVHGSNATTLFSYLRERHAQPFAHRTMAPLAYLTFPYNLAAFSPLWTVPFGVVGLWVGLARAPLARFVATIYAAGMIGFFLILGAPSTYWGEVVNPFVVIGLALFVLCLDQLGSATAWKFKAGDMAAPD